MTHFTESQFWYLVSRNRSTCGVRPYIRATCNPDADSWVRDFIAWWIDPHSGLAIQERSGVLRWMLRDTDTDEILWADSPDALPESPGSRPISVTFINASIYDNQKLLERDPEYIDKLAALPHTDRKRLKDANWNVGDRSELEWPGHYFFDIWTEDWPKRFEVSAIACDPSKGKEKSDYTGIVFLGLQSGKLYCDSIVERIPSNEIVGRLVKFAARYRPDDLSIEVNNFQELLLQEFVNYTREHGKLAHRVTAIHNTTNKLTRIRTLGGYLEQGRLKFRKGSVDNELLVKQLRGFPLADYDDGPDALEMAKRRIHELIMEAEDG